MHEPGPRPPDWRAFSLPAGLVQSDQGDGDLGARMARAAQRGLAQQDAVILVGTDCPQLCVNLLQTAAKRLARCDALLHPTRDGGYALLSCAAVPQRCLNIYPEYFSGCLPYSATA
ncbi:DUF2064 domain-containing protein [Oceanimonas sp. NS1]|nr:DUF2064 domain-containing protein [Oceanimonas sp. NS1]